MEMFSDDRQPILPPQPSLSRRTRASLTALWSCAASWWRRTLDGLARRVRGGIEILRPHRAPSLVPEAPESQTRMTELLASLRSQQQLCLGAITAGDVVSAARPRLTTARQSSRTQACGGVAARRALGSR